MTLYHFCAAHMVTQILRDGLTLGKYPLIGKGSVIFIEPCQWLTTEPDADKQSWATRELIPYSRTAYRLTIQIPDDYNKMLLQAKDFDGKFKGGYVSLVDDWEGSDQWYIYLGKIPPEWIKDCSKPTGWARGRKAGKREGAKSNDIQ